MGPNASEIDLQVGRWFPGLTKAERRLVLHRARANFATNAPYPASIYGPVLTKERSGGIAFDFLRIPQTTRWTGDMLVDGRARVALEYVDHMNFGGPGNFRVLVMLSTSLNPSLKNLAWR